MITQARQDLQDHVGIVVNGFPHRKKLNIILSIANIRCEDIEILLDLSGSHHSTIRLEEIGASTKIYVKRSIVANFRDIIGKPYIRASWKRLLEIRGRNVS
jgi:hypothetical protein